MKRLCENCGQESPSSPTCGECEVAKRAFRAGKAAAKKELAQLRARLAAAEAVIAALPRCDKCGDIAAWESDDGYAMLGCDGRGAEDTAWNEFHYADELRAYLALVEADR